ncbi:MAG: hypothetical protein LBI61_02920 [Puniceicoccales bacterium]|jgi:hypothetical protein|nr:hypothetical protein [Puniceicoccales bacterium]
MVKKIIRACDFVDRVIVRCLLEGISVGVFSFLAMLAACIEGICAYNAKLIRGRRNGTAVE